MYKQIIIARKDLEMSPGKLAAQVSHGSMAFLTNMVRENTTKKLRPMFSYPVWKEGKDWREQIPIDYGYPFSIGAEKARKEGKQTFYARLVDPNNPFGDVELCEPEIYYESSFEIENGLYEQWLNDSFTKCVLAAKNKNHLLKAKTMAEEMGLKEGKDFTLIYDACRTELQPEEENGSTLTVIGFKPMDSEIIDKIGKKYQLYR